MTASGRSIDRLTSRIASALLSGRSHTGSADFGNGAPFLKPGARHEAAVALGHQHHQQQLSPSPQLSQLSRLKAIPSSELELVKCNDSGGGSDGGGDGGGDGGSVARKRGDGCSGSSADGRGNCGSVAFMHGDGGGGESSVAGRICVSSRELTTLLLVYLLIQ